MTFLKFCYNFPHDVIVFKHIKIMIHDYKKFRGFLSEFETDASVF